MKIYTTPILQKSPLRLFTKNINLQQRLIAGLIIVACLFSFNINAQQLLINEFMASNGSTNTDEFGDADDWIEIYNPTGSSVNIGGYYITDDLGELNQWRIPTTNAGQTTISAGGYLLLWADKEPEQGVRHVDIKLGSGGEDLALVRPDGFTIVDSYTFGVQAQDVSEGRTPNGGSNFDFFGDPTPNGANNTEPGLTLVEPVTFSVRGGIYNSSRNVSLSTATSGADIHYTTDGSEPTVNDPQYNGSINISSNTPLRARAFSPPLIESKVRTQTYLFNISHTFPVVAYSADPDEMFDPAIGIYPNFEEDIEIVVNAELYETNGTQGFNMLFESEIQGTGSATNAQKSLALKAKKSLDGDVIPYAVFPNEDLEEYRSLILRNNGQDWNISHFRDAMVTGLVRNVDDVSNVIEEPIIYGQADRPSIVYINGEYWGMHNIRERMDKRYIKNRFDQDDDEIDFLENQSEIREGDFNEWDTFEDFFTNTNFSDDAKFAELAAQVNPDHYRDYVVFNVFVDNADWPGNNNRYWKKRDSDETWRWLTWDLDFSFGLFNLDQPFNNAYFQANSLERLQNPTDFLWPNPSWATDLFNNMLENDQWRYDFINRMADQMNVLYTPERMNARISQYQNLYAPEVQEHHDLWSSGFQVWNQNVQKLRTFANGRPNVVRQHFVSGFNEISGTTNITVNLNSSNRGEVAFSTVNVSNENAPFNGTYFRGIPIPVQAFPNRGYVLNSWSGALNGDDPLESLTVFGGNSNITANFTKGSTSTQSIVINEINYNSPDSPNPNDWVELHNPNNNQVNISGWYFEDESGRFFGLPKNTFIPANGYLILAENLETFSAVYPNVNNVIGSFGQDPRGFGLSGGGELITLKNANGVLIDGVEYDDKSPWPTAPDGDGPTLQLRNPGLNNALASSWKGTPATPGANNGTTTGGPQDQTINFLAISDKSTNAGPFPITATASSGLPVSFVVISGPATVSGNTITLNGSTGTVRVRAAQFGDGQWNAAPTVDRFFNVTNTPTNGGCDDITWTTTSNSITLSGVNSGNYIVKLFGATYNTIYDCTNCAIPVTIGNLANEVHHLDVQLYTATWQAICTLKEDITLGGNPSTEINLSCPSNLSLQIPQGNTSMTVNYSLPITNTNCPSGGLSLIRTGGPASGSTLTANTYTVNYRATDNCGNSENCSFNITVLPAGTTPPTGNYCASTSSQPWQEWIAGVQLGTINNESGKCVANGCGYSDFTNISTNLSKGSNQSIQLTPGLSWSGFQTNLHWRVWIDLNQDGDFSDSGEQILQANPGNQTFNGSINIPNGATNGSTRMRVSVKKNSYPQPCESFTEGEVEDYTINITGGGGSVTPTDYCEAKADRPWQEWIERVALGSINNSSSKCVPSGCGYSDFTSESTNLTAGSNPSINLTPGLSYNGYRPNLYWRVWIDLNGDGDFTDNGERVFQRFNNSGSTVNGNLNIPSTASNGSTRMRVIVSKDNYVGSCANFDQGEVEDYTVVINGGSGASGIYVAPDQEMLFLRGTTTPDGIQLNWATNTEFKNDRFAIGRSYDGVNFAAIEHKDAFGTATTEAVQYQTFDQARQPQGIVYYQIQAIHTQGESSYSNIIEIDHQKSEDGLALYPNPASDQVRVDLSSYAGKPATIQIYNAFGQEMKTRYIDALTNQPLVFDLQKMPAGTYSLTAKIGDHKLISKLLVIVKE